ncbi:M20 family metallo-hydrolase [Secundilactobacillus folii]|uniref:Hydantoinase/carbamoylase family amidase n=1 Tax=Secundilactobacillus folii TaxID=2678357 RepID=A0A7X2XT93_9LACO|nr:M20 family metallo-hydrolase [Secundilactobacillus folii]MTV81247.1 hydantoinase/carbamoylase family amidase [Secundilactobacillus folii]
MTADDPTWAVFKQQFDLITEISAAKTGQNRLVYSQNWVDAQTALIKFGQQAGLTVTVDDYGNVYLDFPGQDDQIIATGSHMDTVVDGGRFDGLYGVLGGLQAIINLRNQFGRPQHTLRLISFSEEEGSRFPTTFSGSKYYVHGQIVKNLTDQNGNRFDQARKAATSQLLALPQVIHERPKLPSAFTELHIEQGPRLENEHRQVGLVSGIVGQRRWQIQVQGVANHAGTTPMTQRHDGLLTAVDLIKHLHAIASELSPDLTFTVGQLNVLPNTPNVIPGKVAFSVDVRHPNNAILDAFETALNRSLTLFSASQLTCQAHRWVKDLPAKFSRQILDQNVKLTRQLGYSSIMMPSGAGHDSYVMNQAVPTAMIFVPSVKGISHAPAEFTHLEDLKTGILVLTASLQHLAYS